jgi:hypothetical protein
MDAKKLLVMEELPFDVIPRYDIDPEIPVFYLSENGNQIKQALYSGDQGFRVPLLSAENRNIDNLICDVIITAAMENEEWTASSVEEAITLIKEKLILFDVELDALLTNSKLNLPITESFTQVAYYDEIPTNVIYGLGENTYLGVLPYRPEGLNEYGKFGIAVFNSNAIVKVVIN